MSRWFLSYNSQDSALAAGFKAALERKDPGSPIFFAKESLRAGGYWLPTLAQEIANATGFVLLVGEKGLGPWQVTEYSEAYDRRVKDHAFAVILVLLDGQPAPGLPFLRQLHWIVTDAPASEKCIGQVLDAAAHGHAPPGQLWRHTAPYRGLVAMTETDSDFFFGRGKETAEVIKSLDAMPNKLPVLLGNSGVGKSSLAQAGVLAALSRQGWPEAAGTAGPWPASFKDSRGWCVLRLRPGAEPIRALVEPFLKTWQFEATDPKRAKAQSSWVEDLRKGDVSLRDLLDATELRHQDELSQPKPPAFFLYIDQGEELYVRAKDERERRRFSEILAQGLADPRLSALMSLRADYFGALQNDEPLYAAHHAINVPPLREGELGDVVGRPAELLSARFDTESLAADITRQAAEESVKDAGALPLLSYLLDDMWTQMVKRGDGVLRLPAAAIELGNVLVKRADDFLAAHPNSEEVLRRIFTLKLATVHEEGDPTRRRAPRSEFTEPEWLLVSELADHPYRVLITATPEGSPDDHEVYAEVAHEAIFRRWDKLKGWIAAEREFLVWKAAIDGERRRWEKAPPLLRDDALLMGLALARAQDWLAKRGSDLPEPHRRFIELSIRRDQRLRRRVRILQFGLALAVPVALLIIVSTWYVEAQKTAVAAGEAAENAKRAAANAQQAADNLRQANIMAQTLRDQSQSLTAFAQDALAQQDPQQAEILALQALPTDTQLNRPLLPESVAILRSALGQDRQRAILVDHIWSGGAVKDIAINADGSRIVTASDDHTGRIWDAQSGASLAVIAGHTDKINSIAFSPDGKSVLTASDDGTARLWDARTGAQTALFAGNGGKVRVAVLSPDGRYVATAAEDGGRIWDLRTPTPSARLVLPDSLSLIAFSPDSKLLVAALDDFSARTFAVGDSIVAVGILRGHNDRINAAAINRDGSLVVTASDDGTARIWSAAGSDAPQTLTTPGGGKVLDASFSPDGMEIVTASDNRAWLWTASGDMLHEFDGHAGSVSRARFSPDGRWIVTASDDQTARIWDHGSDMPVAALRGHRGKVNAAVFTKDEQRLVTGSDDGTARVWDARTDVAASPVLDVSRLDTSDQVLFGSIVAIEVPRAPSQAPIAPQPVTAAADPCAVLGSGPEDPRDAAPNAPADPPPTNQAIAACRTAASNDALHLYQLARGLEKTKALDDAEAQYRAAAKLGYGPADFRLALIGWTRNDADNRRQAVQLLQQGAEAVDPYCHRRLAELYELGDGVAADLKQALLHHIIAARLFANDFDAQIARYRAASIARNLPPADVVTTAKGALAWLSDHSGAVPR